MADTKTAQTISQHDYALATVAYFAQMAGIEVPKGSLESPKDPFIKGVSGRFQAFSGTQNSEQTLTSAAAFLAYDKKAPYMKLSGDEPLAYQNAAEAHLKSLPEAKQNDYKALAYGVLKNFPAAYNYVVGQVEAKTSLDFSKPIDLMSEIKAQPQAQPPAPAAKKPAPSEEKPAPKKAVASVASASTGPTLSVNTSDDIFDKAVYSFAAVSLGMPPPSEDRMIGQPDLDALKIAYDAVLASEKGAALKAFDKTTSPEYKGFSEFAKEIAHVSNGKVTQAQALVDMRLRDEYAAVWAKDAVAKNFEEMKKTDLSLDQSRVVVAHLPAAWNRLSALIAETPNGKTSLPRIADVPEAEAAINSHVGAKIVTQERAPALATKASADDQQVIADSNVVRTTVSYLLERINGSSLAKDELGLKDDLPILPEEETGPLSEETIALTTGLLSRLSEGFKLGSIKECTPPALAVLSGKLDTLLFSQKTFLEKRAKGELFGVKFDKGLGFTKVKRLELVSALDRLHGAGALSPSASTQAPAQSREIVQKVVSGDEMKFGIPNILWMTSPNMAVAASAGTNVSPDSVPASGEAKKPEAEKSEDEAAQALKDKIAESANYVDEQLYKLGNNIDDIPGMEMLGKFGGIKEKLYQKLTKAESIDGVFDSKSQNDLSKVLYGLKELASIEKANGSYNESDAQKIKHALLTSSRMTLVRQKVLGEGELAEIQRYPYEAGVDGAPKAADACAANKAVVLRLLDFRKEIQALKEDEKSLAGMAKKLKAGGKNPEDDEAYKGAKEKYNQFKEGHDQFEKAHRKELSSLEQMDILFYHISVLQENGDYNNKKAAATSRQNLMLDAAAEMLGEYMPAAIGWIKDFFTGTKWGQQLLPLIAQFTGYNLERLWGVKNEAPTPDQARNDLLETFGKQFKETEDVLKAEGVETPSSAAVIERIQADIKTEEDGRGFFAKSANKIVSSIVGKVEKVEMETALTQALDAAKTSAASGGDWKKAYSDRIDVFYQTYQKTHPEATTPEARTAQDQQTLENVNKAAKNVRVDAPANGVVPPPLSKEDQQTLAIAVEQGASGGALAVNGHHIQLGDQYVELLYTQRDYEDNSDVKRFSNDRIQPLQDICLRNADKYALSLVKSDPTIMNNKGGVLSDEADLNTCAVFEELLIHACAHAKGSEFTQEDFDKLEAESREHGLGGLLHEHRHEIRNFMIFRGPAVDTTDADTFMAGIEALQADHGSSNAPGNPQLDQSVLEQSFGGGFFATRILDQALTVVVIPTGGTEEASGLKQRYLDGQKDPTREKPLLSLRGQDVIALIRDKNGTADTSDDVFKELKFNDYNIHNLIQKENVPELALLYKNYNFGNMDGVKDYTAPARCFFNTVLDLGPKVVELGPNEGITVNGAGDNKVPYKAPFKVEGHKRPESFQQFTRIGSNEGDLKAEIAHYIGLDKNRSMCDQAVEDSRPLLDVLFDKMADNERDLRPGASKQSPVIFLNLHSYASRVGSGVPLPKHNGKTVDTVMCMRDVNGKLDFRSVGDKEDYIVPRGQQVKEGLSGMLDKFDPASQNPRYLDLLIGSGLYKKDAGHAQISSQTGYKGMVGIDPRGDTGFKFVNNGLVSVFGSDFAKQNGTTYDSNVLYMRNHITADWAEKRHADQAERMAACLNAKNGHSTPPADQAPSEKAEVFNDASRDSSRCPLEYTALPYILRSLKTGLGFGPHRGDPSGEQEITEQEIEVSRREMGTPVQEPEVPASSSAIHHGGGHVGNKTFDPNDDVYAH